MNRILIVIPKKKHADIQYVDKNGIEWFIEAKSFKSPDKNNAVHKIFGELLKISGLEKNAKMFSMVF